MFEKHEKWFVLGILALVIYYFYKKGKAAQGPAPSNFGTMPLDMGGPVYPSSLVSSAPDGSIVNPLHDVGYVTPAGASAPVAFRPAQPSTVPVSQRITVGPWYYNEAPPVLRNRLA